MVEGSQPTNVPQPALVRLWVGGCADPVRLRSQPGGLKRRLDRQCLAQVTETATPRHGGAIGRV